MPIAIGSVMTSFLPSFEITASTPGGVRWVSGARDTASQEKAARGGLNRRLATAFQYADLRTGGTAGRDGNHQALAGRGTCHAGSRFLCRLSGIRAPGNGAARVGGPAAASNPEFSSHRYHGLIDRDRGIPPRQ